MTTFLSAEQVNPSINLPMDSSMDCLSLYLTLILGFSNIYSNRIQSTNNTAKIYTWTSIINILSSYHKSQAKNLGIRLFTQSNFCPDRAPKIS